MDTAGNEEFRQFQPENGECLSGFRRGRHLLFRPPESFPACRAGWPAAEEKGCSDGFQGLRKKVVGVCYRGTGRRIKLGLGSKFRIKGICLVFKIQFSGNPFLNCKYRAGTRSIFSGCLSGGGNPDRQQEFLHRKLARNKVNHRMI